MPKHVMSCRVPRIVRFSTSGLSIRDLALAWKEKRVSMSWDSKHQTLAECQRLGRIVKAGAITGDWTWLANNRQARNAQRRVLAARGGNVTQVGRSRKKRSKTRAGLKSTSTSTPVPAGFQTQFQVQIAGPSEAQVMDDQPASAPQDLAVPEQVVFSLPWQGSGVPAETESGYAAERRMGQGLNLIQPVLINCRQPTAKAKKGKTKRAKKVLGSQAQQAAGPSTLQTTSASVAPPVIAGPGYDISFMAPTSSHATINPGPVSSQNEDDPIPSFDLFDDDSLGLAAFDTGGAPAPASPDEDAELQALIKMLLGENSLDSEYTGLEGVDNVQDTGVPDSAALAFGDALAINLASQTVAPADLYMEAAPPVHSRISPTLSPADILAAAFAPKFERWNDGFF